MARKIKIPTEIAEKQLTARGFQYAMGAAGVLKAGALETALNESMRNVGLVDDNFAVVIYVFPDGKGRKEYRVNTYIQK